MTTGRVVKLTRLIEAPVQVRVDADDRSVTWRAASWHLALRGVLFVTLGVATPVVLLDGPDPALRIPLLIVTVVTAGWFVAGLQRGGELDGHGIRLDTGRRRPARIPWHEVRSVDITPDTRGNAALVARTTDGRARTLLRAEPADVARIHRAAVQMGFVPDQTGH